MPEIVQRIRKFLNLWYVRYLVATELYMVEPWEKVVIHTTDVFFVLIFGLFWYFNYSIILNGLLKLRDSSRHAQIF